MSRSGRGRATWIVGGLAAVAVLAAACGGPSEDQVAILTEERPPPPATEPAEEMLPAEAQPAAPAEPAPAPTEAPAPPAAPAAVEGPLDIQSAAAVVTGLGESQRAVTSDRVQVYLSMQLSIDGVSAGSVSDVPFVLYTTVGDRTHVQIDQSALAILSAFEDGMPAAAPANLPPIEVVLDGAAQQAYFKLQPLTAFDAGEQPSFLQDLTVPEGAALADLWGRSNAAAADNLLPVSVVGERPTVTDFLALLAAAADGGAILEARADGPGEVAGVATQIYTFVVDLGSLAAEMPPFLAGFLGGPGAGEPPPEDFLGALPPLPAAITVHVDTAGFARQVQVDLDLGAIMMAVFAGFGEMGEVPEGADVGLPEIEYLLSMRFDTLAVNDPSLAVALPDPAVVVDVP